MCGNRSEAAFQMPPQDHSSFAVQAQGDKATEPGALEIKRAEVSR